MAVVPSNSSRSNPHSHSPSYNPILALPTLLGAPPNTPHRFLNSNLSRRLRFFSSCLVIHKPRLKGLRIWISRRLPMLTFIRVDPTVDIIVANSNRFIASGRYNLKPMSEIHPDMRTTATHTYGWVQFTGDAAKCNSYA